MFGGVAMAQESAGQPIYPTLSPGYAGVPEGQFAVELGPDGSAITSANSSYVPQWSANPGIYNTMTSDPGFTEHGGAVESTPSAGGARHAGHDGGHGGHGGHGR
jgi:hypothetical protein